MLAACASTEQSFGSGMWHYQAGLYQQAIPRLVDAVPDLEKSNPADPRVISGYLALAQMAEATREDDRAQDYYDRAVRLVRKHHAGNDTLTRNVLNQTGVYLIYKKRFTEAVPLLEDAIALSRGGDDVQRQLQAVDLDNLAVAQGGAKRYELAAAASDRSLKILDGLPPTKQTLATRGVVLFNRADLLAEQGQVSAADAAYKESLALVAVHSPPWQRKAIQKSYAKFLRAQGREEEAAAFELKAL